MSKYEERIIAEMRKANYSEEYISDWIRVYEETGLDMRCLADGMDVDEFLDAYEEGDLDTMILLS